MRLHEGPILRSRTRLRSLFGDRQFIAIHLLHCHRDHNRLLRSFSDSRGPPPTSSVRVRVIDRSQRVIWAQAPDSLRRKGWGISIAEEDGDAREEDDRFGAGMGVHAEGHH
ncbi:hypothetical protein OPV22_012055 [Ensete ventricosum]|uniref:Uncharacterized protein n=1 Tax=Ensete ventricosum TaxID=4639 RepID=A0AAV8QXN0_ENSVE|nr:hypothetical protein OPV22_012055 [Ensete ventricosum]